MKLGASYNVFDGIELLEASIKSIRYNVDYINVVYQTVSNYGQTIDSIEYLEDLLKRKLIDNLIYYNPTTHKGGGFNETRKRNIGLNDCKINNCTHMMSMDTDECYLNDQLAYAKQMIESNNSDSSACKMKVYYKYPTLQIKKLMDVYVSLIMKIDDRQFTNAGWPVTVDPTRKMKANKLHLFTRNEIEMHHYSYVRTDLNAKLTNSSAVSNYTKHIPLLLKQYEQCTEESTIVTMYNNSKLRQSETIKVLNYFNIDITKKII